MSKHTPGPWRYSRTNTLSSDYWYVIIDPDGIGPITDVGGKDMSGQISEFKYLITDPQIIEANARLIAAAPELLNACYSILKDGADWLSDEANDMLQSAVKKAEG